MKKRVFMCAMVIGMLLSMFASAWADEDTTNYYVLLKATASFKTLYNVSVNGGRRFSIPIQAAYQATKTDVTQILGGTSQARVLRLVSSHAPEYDDAFEDIKIEGVQAYTVQLKGPEKVVIVVANLTGTAKKNGELTILASFLDDGLSTDDLTTENQAPTDGPYMGTRAQATIKFSTENKEDEPDATYMADQPYANATKVTESQVASTADPENSDWNGIDPTFGTLGGNDKDKPKIATSKLVFTGDGYDENDKALKSGAPAEFEVIIEGPGPEIDVYVSASDAKKLWPLKCDKKYANVEKDWSDNISLTQDNIKEWMIPFRVTEFAINVDGDETQGKTTKHRLKIAYNGAQVAYKGFPITISAANDKTGTKPVTKTYKIDIVSSRQVPQWVTAVGVVGESMDKKNTQELPLNLVNGGRLGTIVYTVSADGPYYVTAKGDKIGMSSDVIQPVYNKFGEVETPGYAKIYGKFDDSKKGTDGGTKEVKVSFTLDAVGSVKKTTFKPTVIGKTSPMFDSKNLMSGDNKGKDTSYAGMPNVYNETTEKYTYDGWYKVKTAEAGKVPSVKIAAKGSKTITYSIGQERIDQLHAVGLDFDSRKGQVVQYQIEEVVNGKTTKKKVPITVTHGDDGEYCPIDIEVTADNGTGYAPTVMAYVGVTGEKAVPFLGKDDNGKEIKKLIIRRDAAKDTLFSIGANVGKGKNGTPAESTDVNVLFRLANAKKATENKKELDVGEDTYKLQQLGLEFVPSSEFDDDQKTDYRNHGLLRVGSQGLNATKSTKVNFILSNLGNETKGSVEIVINDPKPVIHGPKSETGEMNVDVTIGEKKTVELKLQENVPSNNATIKWNIARKPTSSNGKITANLVDIKDGRTVIQPRKTLEILAKDGAVDDKVVITATNSDSKEVSDEFTVNIHIASSGGGGDDTPGGEGGDETTTPNSGNDDIALENATIGETKELEEDIATDEELTAGLGEGELTLGAERTVGMLTTGQAEVLDEGRFVIAAILPEISATADGQYGLEVDLLETVKPGAKLYWFAFPKDAPASEDDDIIDFFTTEGADTEVVPEDHVVAAYPWFRAGVTYGPVIAVKAEDAEGGEAVTEGELEGAAKKGTAE